MLHGNLLNSFTLFGKNGKCLVFVCLHDFSFSRTFVVNATKMQDSMNNGAMQLFVIRSVESIRICFHCIQTNEQVSGYFIAFRIIKGNDICIIIVLEILSVYFQDFLIGTEDITDITRFFAVCLRHFPHPTTYCLLVDCWKFNFFRIKLYCHNTCFYRMQSYES